MSCIASGHVILLSLGCSNAQRLEISTFAIYLFWDEHSRSFSAMVPQCGIFLVLSFKLSIQCIENPLRMPLIQLDEVLGLTGDAWGCWDSNFLSPIARSAYECTIAGA
jgi:hypothetical protein